MSLSAQLLWFFFGSSICLEPDGACYPFSLDESVLMDLKALLLEAKQKVPPVLQVLHCGDESMLDIGGKCRAGAPVSSVRLGSLGLGTRKPVQAGRVSLGSRSRSCDLANPSLYSQENGAVPSVEALAIGSLTAPSLKLCRPSRSAILAARTTWPTALWTSELSLPSSPQEASVPGLQPGIHQPSRQEASSLGPAGLGYPSAPQNHYFCSPFPTAIKAHSLLSQTSASSSSPLPPVPGQASPSAPVPS